MKLSRWLIGVLLLGGVVALSIWAWRGQSAAERVTDSLGSGPSRQDLGHKGEAAKLQEGIGVMPQQAGQLRGTSSRGASPSVNVERQSFYQLAFGSESAQVAIQRLRSSSSSPASAAFYMAQVMELCAWAQKNASTVSIPSSTQAEPAKDTSPREQARTKLQSRRGGQFCAGLPEVTPDELSRHWQEAANAGDPVALARNAWVNFEKGFLTHPSMDSAPPELRGKALSPVRWEPSILDALAQALMSRDPAGIAMMGPLLNTVSHQDFLVWAETGEALSQMPPLAWQILACEYGLRCGPDSTALLSYCANMGRCDVQNLEEYYRRYVWTGEDASRFDALRPLMRQLIEGGGSRVLQLRPWDPSKPPPKYYPGTPYRFIPPG